MSGVEPIDPHPSASAVLARGSITSRDAVAPTKADEKTIPKGTPLGLFVFRRRAHGRGAPNFVKITNFSSF